MLRFSDVGMAFGADDTKDARGMAVADIDNDGDLDIIINSNQGDSGVDFVPPTVLRNDIGDSRNSLVIKLTGVDCNRDALGAVVRVEIPREGESPLRLTRHVYCGSGYASQNDSRLFFGLGDYETVSKVEVRWPNGREQVFTDKLQANRFVEIVEGESVRVREFVKASDIDQKVTIR